MTASFRYPYFMLGYQPTFLVPPPSTVYGLLSAVKGDLITPNDVSMGYIFEYDAIFEDLESIYELEAKNVLKAKSNILTRQQLFNVKLWLYISKNLLESLKNPEYPIFLGRSTDLAVISDIKIVTLDKPNKVRIGKTCLPFFPENSNKGVLQALPTYLTDDIPRKPMAVRKYYLTHEFCQQDTIQKIYRDPEYDWGVYIYDSSILANI